MDSRTVVVRRQSEAERIARGQAPVHVTSPERVAELRAICERLPGVNAQGDRLAAALATGPLSYREAVRLLDVIDPHARFVGLRANGINVVRTGWVRERSEGGELHTFGLYVVEPEGLPV